MSEPGRTARAHAIFSEALDRPAGQRAALLDRLCADDSTLRDWVEALELHAEVLELRRRLHGPDHHAVAVTLNNMGVILYRTRRAGDLRRGLTAAPPQLPGCPALAWLPGRRPAGYVPRPDG